VVPSMIDLDPGQGLGTGAFKRRGLPSEDAQEETVVFEVREGGALEDDDKVKHYDADGMCFLEFAWHTVGVSDAKISE